MEVASVDADDRRARFEALYTATYPLILAYALRRTATADDATDVVAETFLTAWRRLDDLPDGDEARLWLYSVARRVLANQSRGVRRRERLHARLLATATEPVTYCPDPGHPGVAAAFGRLSALDREILTLVAVDGLTPAEIAVVLGGSATAVRVRLHRARTRFARALAAEGVPR